MQKISTLVLMLCLTLSGAWCYAHGAAGTKNGKGRDGFTIEIIESTAHTLSDKSSAIVPVLYGHELSIVFLEDLGQVVVEVTTASGAPVDYTTTPTPTGINLYIPLEGDYIVTFTLSNGDGYYGTFSVTD